MLSHFSHVQLCVTPETAVHQAPPSLGFARQEHWSGLPFPSPMHESGKWKVKIKNEVTQSCGTPSNHMDCSLPGSSIHGIFQARVLEWGAIAFSAYVSYSHINALLIQTVHTSWFCSLQEVIIELVALFNKVETLKM